VAEETAFTSLKEANCAYTPTARLTMLIIAREALAGEAVTEGNCKRCKATYSYPSVEKNVLRVILGDGLYRKV